MSEAVEAFRAAPPASHNGAVLDLTLACERSTTLQGGARIRPAEPADLPRIAELVGAGIHPEASAEVWGLAAHTTTPVLVADVDGVVVASLAVLSGTIALGAASVEFTQPEFVVCDPAHRRRGHATTMLRVMHDATESSGIPISLVSGIEYFYRRLGYSYAINAPRRHRLDALPTADDPEWSCRDALPDDVMSLDALQDSVQRHVDATVASTPERWRWLSALDHYQLVVAERNGRLEAMSRVYADDQGVELTESAARSVPAADAILQHVASRHSGRPIAVTDRAGGGAAFLDRRSSMVLERDAYCLRATSAEALVRAIVPALDDRLARSSFAGADLTLPLSLYGAGIEIRVANGTVGGLAQFAPHPGPAMPDVASVPPDLLVDLVFSDLGAHGLEERYPDVVLGEHRALMATLFPPVTSDLLLF